MKWSGENLEDDRRDRGTERRAVVAEAAAVKRERPPPLTFTRGAYYYRGARVSRPRAR